MLADDLSFATTCDAVESLHPPRLQPTGPQQWGLQDCFKAMAEETWAWPFHCHAN
jgi:hypothetical protein